MDNDIRNMDVNRLKNEVQYLRDEISKMKRMYEDLFYNIDQDNFSGVYKKQQDNLRAEVKIAADSISSKVSKEDLEKSLEDYSTIVQTDDKIETAVVSVNNSTDEKLKDYSTITQTAESIKTEVGKSKTEITNETDAKLSNYSTITQTADDISAAVADSEANIKAEIKITTDAISSQVTDLENFNTSVFIQNGDGFVLDGNKVKITGVIFLTDNNKIDSFSIFHDESQGYPQVILSTMDNTVPIIIGEKDGVSTSQNVYIGSRASGNEIATRNWVKNNASSTAVFG